MPDIMLTFDRFEVSEKLPYEIICMTRYGSRWNTFHRKRRWFEEFTKHERDAATAIFAKSHSWMLGKGVPNKVTMSIDTYNLWQKLGAFCVSI